ncbi:MULTISPECIES: hypothetical protein [Chryseobacterium]|uniref:hypothetical protein n=1 Tax=Chryseobacterium TaxID=59732 RepID=UPI00192DB7FE|nr:hypothetical protein [Chryseobacterium cucumeris]QRA41411.1 hypothetical protein JNG87_12300 [Chryseobacterium cucumeris]
MKLNEKIDLIFKLLNFASLNNLHADEEDIRSITMHSISQSIQNYYISLILSEKLEDIKFVNANISEEFAVEELEVVNYNYQGFIKDALFNALFISIESNIRAIARHYEAKVNDINNTSIKITFENLLKTISLFNGISADEKKVILYFFYLRNTMHNFGINTKPKQAIDIEDKTSIVDTSKVKLELIQNQTNNISSKNLFLLFEQVLKVIIRLNSMIPSNEKIKHPLADFDYND